MITNGQAPSIVDPARVIPTGPVSRSVSAGQYHIRLIAAKPTPKAVFFRFEIVRGPHAGQPVFYWLEKTSKSREVFAGLCRACENLTPRDASEFAGKLVLATIKTQKLDGQAVPVVTRFDAPLITEAWL
jgi:hypothetical protein